MKHACIAVEQPRPTPSFVYPMTTVRDPSSLTPSPALPVRMHGFDATLIRRDFAAVQRWAILAGQCPRNDDEEAELQRLIHTLEAAGHVLSPPCRRTARVD